MRFPVAPPPANNSSNPKPVNNNNEDAAAATPTLGFNSQSNTSPISSCYEPTSVLDLRRSPSPVPEKPPSATDVSVVSVALPTLEFDEHVLRNMDWDSIMRDLGLDDDSANALKSISHLSSYDTHIQNVAEFTHPDSTQQAMHPDFNFSDLLLGQIPSSAQNFHNLDGFGNSFDVGLDFIEELISAADCFDKNELQLAQVILARLNQRLRSPAGKPLQRAAFYFKEALQGLLAGSTRTSRISSSAEVVQTIRSYKAFCGISPVPMFTHFTNNQALLESLDGAAIHIIDFDIGLGGQYASLIREIAEKYDSIKAKPPVLRITAIVPEEFAIETKLVKENLIQFAQELQIRFQIEFVPFRAFEMLQLKAFKFVDGERVAILLSPVIFQCRNLNIPAFLTDLRRVSPSVLVFVDGEAWMETSATSFRRNLVNGLEFYATMFESLEAAAVGGGEWGRKIEWYLIRPRIMSVVETVAGRRAAPPWREMLRGAGMRAMQLSQFADYQAECLLGKLQVRGFHVGKRGSELVLCWRDKVLLATSAWRC